MGATASGSTRPGALAAAGAAGALGLAAVAYRELLWFQPERALPEELEAWFFVPSEGLAPLVVGLALWLLYRRWQRLAALPAAEGVSPVGIALLLVAVGWHVWARWTAAVDLLVPSLMALGLGAAWLWRGARGARAVLLPVAFLGFALSLPAPLFNELVFRLQLATAELSGFLLYLLGVPHVVSGDQILRTENTFSVIESCSGLRSVEILTMLAVLMVDLFRRRPLHAWAVVLAAPPVAFLLNGARALLLILNPHSEIAAVHNLQGVVILLGGLVLVFLWDGLLGRVLDEPPRSPRSGQPAGPLGVRTPVAVALGIALLACVASSILVRGGSAVPASRGLTRELATRLGPSADLELDRSFVGSTGFGEFLYRHLDTGGAGAKLFVAVGSRAVRHRSVLSPKLGFPGSGWTVERSWRRTLEEAGPTARARLLRRGSERWLYYHWYEGAGPLWREALRSWLALDRAGGSEASEIVAVRLGVRVQGPPAESIPHAEEEILRLSQRSRPLLLQSHEKHPTQR